MVALARNLYLIRSRFLTGSTAIFVIGLRQAPAWQMRTLVLPIPTYLRFIIHPISVPAVTPIAKVVATVSTGWRWMR